MNLWESRAIAMMNQPHVWAAVESVSAELQMSCGVLERGELSRQLSVVCVKV
jgi:hypothetical protein